MHGSPHLLWITFVPQEKKKRRPLWRRGMRMLTATNGNNSLQGPMRSQHGLERSGGAELLSLSWPQRHLLKEPEGGALAFTSICPTLPPAGGPGNFSLTGAFRMRQGRVQAPHPHPHPLGLGEMSSFVSNPSYKTCGFWAPHGGWDNLQLPSPAQPPFP